MAEPVNKLLPWQRALTALLLAVGVAPALAQEALPDPTRPSNATHAGDKAGAIASTGPVLQSVLIAPGRRVAVISGQTVRTGDRIGEARVASIAETEVLLDDGKEKKTLKLYPATGKRVSRVPASAKAVRQQ